MDFQKHSSGGSQLREVTRSMVSTFELLQVVANYGDCPGGSAKGRVGEGPPQKSIVKAGARSSGV